MKCTWYLQDTQSLLPQFLMLLICLEGLWSALQAGLGQAQSLENQGYTWFCPSWSPEGLDSRKNIASPLPCPQPKYWFPDSTAQEGNQPQATRQGRGARVLRPPPSLSQIPFQYLTHLVALNQSSILSQQLSVLCSHSILTPKF